MSIDRVVVYSGGMDSYSLLRQVHRRSGIAAHNLRKPEEGRLFVISFQYSQRHAKELDCVQTVCRKLGNLPLVIVDLPFLHMFNNSALVGHEPIPHGHYAADVMKKTVVPGRNTVMLSTALAFAEGLDSDAKRPAIVYYGAHSGDHHIYPDCRPEFIKAMQATFLAASDGRVSLRAPFVNQTKGSLLLEAIQDGVLPAEYADTWTCYEGGEHPCGKCGSCVERAEAFAFAGVDDPLITLRDRIDQSATG